MILREANGAARRRFWLAMIGFLLAAMLLPFSYKVESRLETAVHIQGGQAEAVDEELTRRFQSPFVHRVIFVVRGLPDPATTEGSIALDDALDGIAASLRATPGVAAVLSHLDWQDPLFLSPDPNHLGTLIILGLAPQDGNVEAMIPRLRALAATITTQLQPKYPNLHLELTGEVPLNFDLRDVSSHDVRRAELRVLPVTLILLVIAFGSLVAALLPLGTGLLAISMTLGAASLLAHHLHLSILIQNIATMLGLGLGIDYALLMVNRFREALAEGHPPGPAADLAFAQAGHTLLISAATVAIGFSALLTVPISELRSIGIAGLLVAAISVLLCTCILPWILGHLGHRIDAFRPKLRRTHTPEPETAACKTYSARWHRWGQAVTARPWTALLLAGLPLLLLAYQARRLTIAVPPGNWLPHSAESVQALHSLESMQRDGIVQSLRVVLELPADAPPRSPAGWQALTRLTQALAADPRAAEVISLPTLLNFAPSSANFDRAPEPIRRSFLSTNGRATLLEVLPATVLTPADQIRWARELSAADIPRLAGIRGATVRVGGIASLNADYATIVNQRLPKVIAAVILGSLLALLLGLRSLFAAVKAVLLNLLSVGASFGALVLVIQEGHGSRLLGFGPASQSVFPIVPILAFAIVFGLSMDYEVFLVARVLEERRRGLTNRAAIVEALASTARLITSAAAIMIVVFAAFTLGSFLVVKMLGFTLAVAVLLDATVVRMVVGPALLQLAGDWNWWPYGLRGAKAVSTPPCVEAPPA